MRAFRKSYSAPTPRVFVRAAPNHRQSSQNRVKSGPQVAILREPPDQSISEILSKFGEQKHGFACRSCNNAPIHFWLVALDS